MKKEQGPNIREMSLVFHTFCLYHTQTVRLSELSRVSGFVASRGEVAVCNATLPTEHPSHHEEHKRAT